MSSQLFLLPSSVLTKHIMGNLKYLNRLLEERGFPITKQITEKQDTQVYVIEKGRYSFDTKKRTTTDIKDDMRALPAVVVVNTVPDERQKKSNRQEGDIVLKVSDSLQGVTSKEAYLKNVVQQASNVLGVKYVRFPEEKIKYAKGVT